MSEIELLETLRKKERRLYAIDKQFISDGMRLILLLPATSLLFLFGAWAFNDGSPKWWGDNIEPTIEVDFSIGLTLFALTITLVFSFSLITHMREQVLLVKCLEVKLKRLLKNIDL